MNKDIVTMNYGLPCVIMDTIGLETIDFTQFLIRMANRNKGERNDIIWQLE